MELRCFWGRSRLPCISFVWVVAGSFCILNRWCTVYYPPASYRTIPKSSQPTWHYLKSQVGKSKQKELLYSLTPTLLSWGQLLQTVTEQPDQRRSITGCLAGPSDLVHCSVTVSADMLVVLSSLLSKPVNRDILESAASLSEHPTFRRGNVGDRTSQDLGVFRSSNQLPGRLTGVGSVSGYYLGLYFLISRNVTNFLKL